MHLSVIVAEYHDAYPVIAARYEPGVQAEGAAIARQLDAWLRGGDVARLLEFLASAERSQP